LTFSNYSLNGLLNPVAKPFKQTEYRVTLVSTDGCQAEDRVLVRVDTEPDIYIPNVFSPWDANSENDVVYIFAKDGQVSKIHSFQIFDRWGEMVFQDNDFLPNEPEHGWDGRTKGRFLDPAVFVYWAKIELIDGRIILYKGDITLLR
jgi:gliding motility-associated-like protein